MQCDRNLHWQVLWLARVTLSTRQLVPRKPEMEQLPHRDHSGPECRHEFPRCHDDDLPPQARQGAVRRPTESSLLPSARGKPSGRGAARGRRGRKRGTALVSLLVLHFCDFSMPGDAATRRSTQSPVSRVGLPRTGRAPRSAAGRRRTQPCLPFGAP